MNINRRDAMIALCGLLSCMMSFFSIEFLSCGICLLLLLFLNDKRIGKITILITTFIIMIGLVNIFNISFTFIPQAKTLLDSNSDVFDWLRQGHIHAIRLLIAYPGYLLSKLYNISLNMGYTYYLIIIFFFTDINLCNICSCIEKQSVISLITIALFILGLFLVMNGRIIFAFLGFSVLIYCALKLVDYKTRISIKDILSIILGISLSCVSSGCMMISIISILIFLYLKWKFHYSYFEKCRFILSACVIVLLSSSILTKSVSYVIAMINKNLTFFGGGIAGVFGMLQHGLGQIIPAINPDHYLLLFISSCFVILMNVILLRIIFIKRYDFEAIIAVAINLCCYGILVGYSMGSMLMIPCIILINKYMNRVKIKILG